jgi:hypothetical protein
MEQKTIENLDENAEEWWSNEEQMNSTQAGENKDECGTILFKKECRMNRSDGEQATSGKYSNMTTKVKGKTTRTKDLAKFIR